jgi:hypothetical protein
MLSKKVDNGLKLLFRVSASILVQLGKRSDTITQWTKEFRRTLGITLLG